VDRIAVIGCGGSGKSRLARALGGTLGITPVHLDGLYYGRDWTPLDAEQFAALQRDLVAAPRWIIDGNYTCSLPVRLWLLPRPLKGRASGPVFVTHRKARVQLPAADLDPSGRARLSYQQAEALFSAVSGGATLH